MGIMDKVSALLPWRGERRDSPPARTDAAVLRDDLDRWLQRLVDDRWGFPAVGESRWMPAASVRERGDEVVVTVEVPGLSREDLELMITPQGLVVRGEKREEKEDTRKGAHVVERRYGAFVRTVPLPTGLDLDRAEARVANGVLTVRFPKAAAREGARRIAIER